MSITPVPDAAVIVVAAGSGLRLGAGAPKAFVGVDAHTVLWHSLIPILGMRRAAQLVLVVPPGLEGEARTEAMDAAATVAAAEGADGATDAADRFELVRIVAGGATRQDSVAAGLRAVWPQVRTVLVHDAARSLTPSEVFDRVIEEVERTGAAVIPGLPVVDTVKRVDAAGAVGDTVDRDELLAVQTPQGFRRDVLDAAYAGASAQYTDDAALVAAAGHPVRALDGHAHAFKITTPADLQRARTLLGERAAQHAPSPQPVRSAQGEHAPALAAALTMRVGIGSDVHAYAAAGSTRTLWLAGLPWPGERALEGHSDGDVVTHAIVDALLSAADLGDIGGLFGTDDPAVEGAHAEVFLTRTRRVLADAGWAIGNVSVQVQARAPRFSPRRLEAQAALSALLGAPVTVAATTTDGLGFTGRGEGIAATATALIVRA